MQYDSAQMLSLFSAGEYERVYEIIVPFADTGVPDAQCMLGLLYQLGLGVPQDGPKAVSWYLRAAAQGHPLAMNNLGTIYLQGMPGIVPDRETALEYYKQAHSSGFNAMDITEIEDSDC